MNQLCKQRDDEYHQWSSGFAEYFPGFKVGMSKLTVGVKCRLGDLEITDIALFDTGAEWTLIGGETAEILEGRFSEAIETINYSTRLGKMNVTLRRLPILLLADDGCGADLYVESTVAVAPEWTGPIVLGYRGFLERIRFALEPRFSAELTDQIYFDGAM